MSPPFLSKSGVQTCFGPSTLGAPSTVGGGGGGGGGETRLESRTKEFTPHCVCIVFAGFGYHSFRLTEVMGGGSIPVILIDNYVLPFEGLLDWSSFSIRLPEHQLTNLPVPSLCFSFSLYQAFV